MLMQSDTVLEVAKLSKIYSRSQGITRKRLANTFVRSFWGRSLNPESEKLAEGEFWSLKNISFSLKRGEALGIVGVNGAGKSTLLRLLAGQVLPDQGEIRVLGKSVAMIDLTAGFQMSASGARNIYLRGAMLGRSKEEIAATYDEIVDFAELGDAIHAPVSTYSSGMMMRLAFSIMVTVEPDVLFIDEILSVGDFRFKQKCLSKIRELRESSAFVFVSHSMDDIKRFCDQAIFLHQGHIVSRGEPEEVINAYEEMKLPKALGEEKKRTEILKPQFHNKDIINDVEHYWCDRDGKPLESIGLGEDLHLKVAFRVNYRPRHLIIGVPVWTEGGTYVTGFSTETQELKFQAIPYRKNEYWLKVPSLNFNPDTYISNLAISDGNEFLFRGENPIIVVENSNKPHWGIVSSLHFWTQTKS